MLLAYASLPGTETSSRVYAGVVATHGPPTTRLTWPEGGLLAWESPVTEDPDHRWAAVGHVSFESFLEGGDLLTRAVAAHGDFAFAGIDHGLVLTSGGAGGYRPIYVHATSSAVVASTSFDVVASLAVDRRHLDVDAVAASLAPVTLFWTRSDRTLLANVQRVPMYEAWRISIDGEIVRRSTFRPLAAPSYGASDWAHELREALRGAVARACGGARRVGVMVSGGLDSSSVLGVAVDLKRRGELPAELHAYSYDYETSVGDDRPYRRSLLDFLGMHADVTTAEDAASAMPASFVRDGMPFFAPSGGYIVALAMRARARRVSTMLTGVGGDNVVDGDPASFGDLAREGKPVQALLRAARLGGAGTRNLWWRLWQLVCVPYLRSLVPFHAAWTDRRARKLRLGRYGWAGPRLREYLLHAAEAPAPRVAQAFSPGAWFEALVRSPYIKQACIVRSQIETATGCPVRDPFFDETLIRLVASIPPLEMLRGDLRRGLLREAVRGLVPDDVRRRRTKGLMEPGLADMVRKGGGFEKLRELATVTHLADLGLVEPRRFRASFEQLAGDPADAPWLRIWPSLATESWLRSMDAKA